MSDQENDYNSDQEVSKDHEKLLLAVTKLDKRQRVKKADLSEPTLKLSEFNLIKSGVSDKLPVNPDDGVDGLRGKTASKAKKVIREAKTIAKPLETVAADRLNRKVVYENVKTDLERWDATITKNRAAPTLTFPLGKQSFRMPKTDEFVERFRVKSDLEKDLEALEPPKPIDEKKQDNFPLTLNEIRERRREAAKFKIQQSYEAAKAMRQNKIKSKKYHRILKKSLIKQQLKEFEKLQKSDPEAALEKMKQLDKVRAEERMSLKHKNSGQWAKNKLIRAKYDKDSRQALAKQLSIGRELTQKIKIDDSDDEEIDNTIDDFVEEADKNNPYFKKTTSEIDAFVSGYRKFSDEQNKLKENKKLTNNSSIGDVEKSNTNDTFEKDTTEDEVVENEEKEDEDDSSIENKKKIIKKKTIKKVKNNKKRKITKSGTSDWSVESFDDDDDDDDDNNNDDKIEKKVDNSKSFNLDNLFDDMETKIRQNANKKIKTVKKKLKKTLELNEKNNDDDTKNNNKESDKEYTDLSFKKAKLRPELDGLNETDGDKPEDSLTKTINDNALSSLSSKNNNSNDSNNNKKLEIDPTKFIKAKPKHMKTMLPDDVTGGDEGLDDSEDDEEFKENQHKLISEAFADDDIVDQFNREKQEEIEKSKPEEINTVLPGWGSWTGKNIKVSKRKQKRFILKFAVDKPRKDENKGDVVLFEGGNQKIRNHLVSDLPYPFESVADYENSIRAPIGRLFVPENAHKKLTKPSVQTIMGQIIEPMDEDALLSKDKKIEGQLPKKTNSKNKKIEKKDFKKKNIKKKFIKKNVKKNNINVEKK